MKETREQIRKKYKLLREQMSKWQVQELSEQIARQIIDWEVYQNMDALYVYYPLGNEVSLLMVMEDAWKKRKRLAFPKIQNGEMYFYEITSIMQLEEGCFHVMEPVLLPDMQPVCWEEALCFVPGVVFDRSGGRFGYGKGYYDRYFQDRKNILLAGCAYEAQVLSKLPVNDYDQKMDFLITEKGCCKVSADTRR